MRNAGEDLGKKPVRPFGQLQHVSGHLRVGEKAHDGVTRIDPDLFPLPVVGEAHDPHGGYLMDLPLLATALLVR
jgi:hypothetical protein